MRPCIFQPGYFTDLGSERVNKPYVVSVDVQPQLSVRLQCIGWLVKLVQCPVASGEVLAFDCSVVYVVSLGHAEHGLTQRCGCPLNTESEL